MTEVVQLPPLLVLKLGGYAYFEHASDGVRGFVNCSGESVFDPYAKIEVENAKINNKYVHLRFSASNRYWGRPDPNSRCLVASSDQPEEDVSKQSCTLFEPKYSGGSVSFTHVQSGWMVAKDAATDRLVFVQSSGSTSFGFVNWATLVKLPKRVAFKASNGKYVGDLWKNHLPYVQAGSIDGNQDNTIYEVQLQPDGHLRVKSVHYDKFWRRSPDWIWSDSKDETGSNKDTLFWPTKVSDTTVALRNAGNDHFVIPLSTDKKVDCLNCAASTMTNQTKYVVEELVLARNLYNVRYRLEDARVFGETPIMLGSATGKNESDREASLTVTVEYTETTSRTFTNSYSFKVGAKTSFRAGFPFIADGKVEVSAEVATTIQWDTTTTETKKASATYGVTVPPRSTVVVHYVATKGTCSVPFSYTEEDKSSTDGLMVTSEHIDGVFTGVSYYNHDFTQPSFAAF